MSGAVAPICSLTASHAFLSSRPTVHLGVDASGRRSDDSGTSSSAPRRSSTPSSIRHSHTSSPALASLDTAAPSICKPILSSVTPHLSVIGSWHEMSSYIPLTELRLCPISSSVGWISKHLGRGRPRERSIYIQEPPLELDTISPESQSSTISSASTQNREQSSRICTPPTLSLRRASPIYSSHYYPSLPILTASDSAVPLLHNGRFTPNRRHLQSPLICRLPSLGRRCSETLKEKPREQQRTRCALEKEQGDKEESKTKRESRRSNRSTAAARLFRRSSPRGRCRGSGPVRSPLLARLWMALW